MARLPEYDLKSHSAPTDTALCQASGPGRIRAIPNEGERCSRLRGTTIEMKTFDARRALTWLGLAAVSGYAYAWWLRAPVIDILGLQTWRVLALATAALVGGIGTLTTRSWVRVSVAASIGFSSGAAWSEWWFNDVRIGLVDAFVSGVANQG